MLQATPGRAYPPLPGFADLHRSMQRGSFHTSAEWLPLPPSVTVESTTSTVPTTVGAAAIGSLLRPATAPVVAAARPPAARTGLMSPTRPATASSTPCSCEVTCVNSYNHDHRPAMTTTTNSVFRGGAVEAVTPIADALPRTGLLPMQRSARCFLLMCERT